MRVLISGSSGFIGRALTDTLTATGHQPIALTRTPSAPAPNSPVWEPIARNSWDTEVGFVDAVVNLAGANLAAKRWTPQFKDHIRGSRVDGTSQLCKHLASLNQRPQVLISASAIGIYGDRGDEILTESSPTGHGFLAQLCRDWEAACIPATEAGIRVVNLRIGMVLGPSGGALAKLLPIFRLGLGGKLGSGRQWMSWIALSDLITIILRAISDPGIIGPVNAVSPNPITNAEFTKTLGRTLKRPAFLPVPAFALRVAVGPMADEALLASTRVQPQKLLKVGHVFQYPDIATALRNALPVQN